MFNRIGNAIEAGRQAVLTLEKENSKASIDNYPASFVHQKNCSAFVVLDSRRFNYTALAEEHSKNSNSKSSVALMVSDVSTIIEAQTPGIINEYLPPALDLALSMGDHPDLIRKYRLTRLKIIFSKWNVSECVWLGNDAADLLYDHQIQKGSSLEKIFVEKYSGPFHLPV